MKATLLFRDQLDLSQEALAQYLTITRSQLAMYEVGKRELPSAALVRLAEMALFFGQLETITKEEEFLLKQESEVKALLAFQTKELEYQQIKAQRALDRIQKKYYQNIRLHSLALHLQKSNSVQAEILLQQALTGIERNGLAAQIKQNLKLKSVNSQLDYIQYIKTKYSLYNMKL